jgi:branched-chain amino acid transport system substrate-binding protein
MLNRRDFGLVTASAVVTGLTAGGIRRAKAAEPLRIGGLATLEGPFAEPGKDSFRGIEMALAEFGPTVAGRTIAFSRASSDGNPDVALASARRLVDQDKVELFVGPLSGSEGIRIKDYAKTVPHVTFFNGSSAAVETTLVDPSPNFYRFNTDGAQWTAALGNYIKKTKGWTRIVLVSEDYSFPYAQIFGLMGTYCADGGRVTHKFFVPLGTKDYSSVIAQLPDKGDVDAIFVVLGGSDAVNFLSQYTQAGGDVPMIGGSIAVDQTVLAAKGPVRAHLPGVLSSGPISDNDPSPAWQSFVAAYRKQFPTGLPSPSLFCFNYYVSTKAALLGIQAVNGDLSDGGVKYRAALHKLRFDTPTGPVFINKNRQATATIFVNEIVEKNGDLTTSPVQKFEGVDQFLGLGEAAYLKLGLPTRDNPSCP